MLSSLHSLKARNGNTAPQSRMLINKIWLWPLKTLKNEKHEQNDGPVTKTATNFSHRLGIDSLLIDYHFIYLICHCRGLAITAQ
jgi:hypothetical protein